MSIVSELQQLKRVLATAQSMADSITSSLGTPNVATEPKVRARRKGQRYDYGTLPEDLKRLNVGEFVVAPKDAGTRLYTYVHHIGKRNNMKFSIRAQKGGIQVTRIV